MDNISLLKNILGWTFGMVVLATGILNLVLVHPVPGMIYLVLSLVFFPPVNNLVIKTTGYNIPTTLKIILGIMIVWFTLGISDLGEMYGF